ncbi:MAG: double zinc ribbon domain-containing protein [Eubacteriales bacterium]|nr:double zinc ribbon domain-containing protein [Eubacteriales bacterium]
MSIAQLVYPSHCMLCGAFISDQQHGICPDCRRAAEKQMERSFLRPPRYVDALVCAGSYAGGLGQAIRRMKFHSQRADIQPLTELMMTAWEMQQLPKPMLVTCVPISAARAHMRGFNQSAALAQAIAAAWNIPFEETLRRHLLSRRQSELHAADRWKNAEKAYYARSRVDLTGKTVVLIDDVVTTGATASACAMLLRDMGAQKVFLLAAARAGGK